MTHDAGVPGLPGDVTIRALEAGDAAAIAEIRNQPGVLRETLALPFRGREAVDAWLARLSARRTEGIELCALVGARVVGHGGFDVAPPRRSHSALLGLGVHDAYAGRGVGAALLAALVAHADHVLGLRRLELTVFVANVRAIALYRRFGFVEEGRSRAYAVRDGELADVLHMARFVDAPALARA